MKSINFEEVVLVECEPAHPGPTLCKYEVYNKAEHMKTYHVELIQMMRKTLVGQSDEEVEAMKNATRSNNLQSTRTFCQLGIIPSCRSRKSSC